MLASCEVETPVGMLRIVAGDSGLRRVEFADGPAVSRPRSDFRAAGGTGAADHPLLRLTVEQLTEFFAGRRKVFEIPLDPLGTPFQLQVWQALRSIPYGLTSTYARLAREIGAPAAVRAVGRANGANPLPIVVPCHRVIGSDGGLCGFGGGLWRKQWLLEHEGALARGAARADSPLFETL